VSNSFDVGVVPGDVVIEQDPVAAQDIPSHRADPAGSVTGVQLGQRRVRSTPAPWACSCDILVHIN
jgi:hypothetical protein